jgi:hypothetical protein
MTRDPRQPLDLDALDDDAIGGLVRDVAAGWSMPPVRLDAPGWRDRVRDRRSRRFSTVRGAFGRLGQAAMAAVALTVAAALVAVVITRPPSDAGKSPGPSTGATTPGDTSAPAASPLPGLALDGELPDPATLVVELDEGSSGFARVDLATGSLTVLPTGGRYGSAVHAYADGTWLCLCLGESGYATDASRAVVTLDRYDASDKRTSSTEIESFAGEPYPREPGDDTHNPGNAFTAISVSDDGRLGYVGWSVLGASTWHSVLLVVNLSDGTIASRLDLPDSIIGEGDTHRMVTAPSVLAGLGEGRLLVARSWYEWTRLGTTIQMMNYRFDNDVFRATFDPSAPGAGASATPLSSGAGCGDAIVGGGALASGGAWLACASGSTPVTTVRRLAADGSLLGDTRITASSALFEGRVVAAPDGEVAFAWDPASATLTRVDLATGEATTGSGPTAALDRGPLVAFGDWLAPTAAAKSRVRGALAVSPDRGRVYAIGVVNGGDEREPSGSTGLFVFDADALKVVAHHAARADYVSLALSPDGRFVYAAGLPGVDAAGRGQPRQGASITVLSSADGAVRLIAGELGFGMVSFMGPILD